MSSLVRLADRKGLLKGKVNQLQEEALQWLIVKENNDAIQLEQERMKYTIFASNPQLWKVLYEESEEEAEFGRVEWSTPTTAAEVEELEQIINATHQMMNEPAGA